MKRDAKQPLHVAGWAVFHTEVECQAAFAHRRLSSFPQWSEMPSSLCTLLVEQFSTVKRNPKQPLHVAGWAVFHSEAECQAACAHCRLSSLPQRSGIRSNLCMLLVEQFSIMKRNATQPLHVAGWAVFHSEAECQVAFARSGTHCTVLPPLHAYQGQLVLSAQSATRNYMTAENELQSIS